MKICIIFLVISAMIGGCSYLADKTGVPHDSELEELVEKVLEVHLKLPAGSLDLTPESPEN